MIAKFDRDRAQLELNPHEYAFLHLALSYVLHGVRLADHDFANILGMPRSEAEDLYSRLQAAESAARAQGSHWLADPGQGPSGALR